ncbi:MAG: aldehyde dehydrogenase [Phycisphaerales bacterium]
MASTYLLMAAGWAHSNLWGDMQRILNLIDGKLVPGESGEWIDSIEPATSKAHAQIAASNKADVDCAVDAASNAFNQWSHTPAARRSELLLKLAHEIDDHCERLASVEAIDQGQTITFARTVDIPRAAANLRFFATAILHDTDHVYHTDAPAVGSGASMTYVKHVPRGVAGCISPWNLPLYLFTWKIAPALAAGCTVVAKPSELSPATACELGKLAIDVGFPAGVLNIIHGYGKDAGEPIISHPSVPSISFTGGTATGARIASVAGPMFKRMSLELGGKNPFLIFEDADVDKAIDTATRAAFTNQGEICLCGSRIYAHESIFEKVVRGIAERAHTYAPGDPLDHKTRMGALISADHRAKIERIVDSAHALGGKIHCGGARPNNLPERVRDGFFYQPTVITGLVSDCDVEQEEIFGPVVSITPFATEDEAIALANGTKYGLASVVFTENINRAHRVADLLHAGIAWINCWMVRDLRTPFGGMKASGIGREGGIEALRFFTEARSTTVAFS